MRLILIAALVAVSGAAKLDRTYLPPASAKTAGGAGFLQTPFSGNSFNNGLGGLPKGSFENDNQGVVVDAAAAGTRASESGGTGLGAPRIAYGSTHSKVGAAAFSEPAGFRQYDSHSANVQGSPQFSAPDHSSLGEAGFKTGPVGFNQYNAHSTANVQGSQQFSGPERPRASIDREASILRFESEVGPENFHYGFETDNGITAEENGVATNGVQAQGGFSYTGDDGQVYSVSYTADEGGYQPKGDHLPTPPPIPEEILKSLEQNAREEASGIVDDGSYDAQKYNVGSDYTDGGASGKYTHQSSKFGGSEADATASGTFINNQGFKKPSGGHSAFNAQGSSLTGQNRQPSHSNKFSGQFGSGSNGALNQQSEQLSHAGQSGYDDGTSGTQQGPSGFSGQISGSHYSAASQRPSSNALSGQSAHASAGQTSHDHADLNADQGSASFGQGSFGFSSNGQNLNTQSGHGFAGQSSQINSASGSNHGSVSSSGQGSFGFGSNGASKRPNVGSQSQSSGFTGQTTQDGASSGQFGQFNSGSTHGSASTQFGGSYQGNNAGNRNEYLPPVNRPQSGRPQASRPQSGKPQKYTEPSTSEEASANAVPLGQQDLQSESRPQGSVTSFGKPVSSGFSTENTFGTSNQNKPSNGRRPSSAGNGFSQGQSSHSENVARPNEYLPPTNNQNNRPQSQPQRPSNGQSQYNQQYNAQTSSNFQSPHGRPQTIAPGSSTGSHTKFESQPQQTNGFQTQPSRPGQTGNRFSAPSTSIQSTSGFGLDAQKATKQPDTELTTPLENDNADTSASHSNIHTGSSTFASSGSQLGGRPTQSTFTSQSHSQNAPSTRPHGSSPRPFGQPQNSAFPTQSSQSQFSQSTQFNQPQQQSQSYDSFSQNNDAQFSPSTQRPSYAQQPQTADDSYYYNQPSKPFGTPETSRFLSTPSNQFNTQQPSFAQNTHASGSLEDVLATFTPGQAHGSTKYPRPPTIGFPATSAHAQAQYSGNLQGSTKYPRPPTLAPTAPSAPSSQYQGAAHGESLVTPDTSSHAQAQFSGNLQGSTKYPRPPTIAPPAHSAAPQSQYQGAPHGETLAPPATSAHAQAQYSSNLQGSTKYPRPPTLAPSAAQSQYQGAVHGVTQASISPFPSQTPTQATQFTGQTQFGSRPTYQQPQLSQTSQSASSSFSQKPTRPSFGQQPSTASTFSQTGGSSFQSQSQSIVSQGEPQGHDSEKPVTSPQYTGEIYEYNKPAQSLPPPDSTPASTTGQGVQSQGHFGSQPSRPQFGQTDDEEHQRPTSQFNVQPTGQVQGTRPQFGGQSRPQFNQNAPSQTNNFATQPEESTDDNKPYGALAQSQSTFGSQSSQQGSHPELSGQVSKPQFGQPVQSQANFATQPTDDSKPFGALAQSQSTFGSQTSQQGSRPFGVQGTKPQVGQTQNQDRFGAQSSQQVDHNIPEPSGQPSQETDTENVSSQGFKNQSQSIFSSPCCQDQPDRRPQNQSQFGSRSQFGQTSFAGAQGFKPASSFAGKGEKFDASRVPPSFDEKTGYHY